MEKPVYQFDCKIDELPVLSKALKESYVRDQVAFKTFSPDFNAAYLAAFEAEMEAADTLINPVKFTKESKKLTQRLNENIAKLKPLIYQLEAYAIRAEENLKVAPKDFGFSRLRTKMNTQDAEGSVAALKTTLQFVDANLAALQEKGFSAAARTELSTLQAAIKAGIEEQNKKLDERAELVQANIATLNTLWTRLQDVMKVGKALYKSSDPVKLDDYTKTTIMKSIRRERQPAAEPALVAEKK